MEKNPAYSAMEIDPSIRPQGDEGSVTVYDYASPDMDMDPAVNTPNDEDSLQSASYI